MNEYNYYRNGRYLHCFYLESKLPNQPLIIDIHGGGFGFGEAADDIGLMNRLAKETGFNIASLDYRLSPKYKIPSAIDDCVDLVKCLLEDNRLSFDHTRLYLLGHSAGANLAIQVALQIPIQALVIDYPWLDLNKTKRKRYPMSIPSIGLTWFGKRYCPNPELRKTYLASPLYLSEEQAKVLPPTLILTSGQDSLQIDGEKFFDLLKRAGVPVKHKRYPLARHGFIEVVSDGRNQVGFLTSKKTVKEQNKEYEKAIADIAEFLQNPIEKLD